MRYLVEDLTGMSPKERSPVAAATSSAPVRNSTPRNAVLNFAGSVIPICVTLATVPPYLKLIGDVRFGILAFVWVFLNYFGLFEMGLGRATSKYIAETKTAGSDDSPEAIFWTAVLVNLALGLIGGLALWLCARTTMPLWLKADGAVRVEVARALPWLAAAVPVATLTSVFIGALEGCEQFGVLNFQQIGATTAFQIAPLCVAYFIAPRVDWLIATAVMTRMVSNIPLLVSCARHVPLRHFPSADRGWLRRLFSYGAWISVSGILGPILTSLDRFIIGIVQGAQAVTYYSIPYSVATKLSIIPACIARALFPRFSAQSSSEARELARRGILAVIAVVTPIAVLGILVTGPFFKLWIGAAVAARCTRPSEIMLAGAWINAIAFVPYGLLQGQGRPDVTAKLHLIELAPFVVLLWAGIHFAGVTGAAAVWSIRLATDTALLLVAARMFRAVALSLVPSTILVAFALVSSIAVGDHFPLRVLSVFVLGAASLWAAHAISPEVTRWTARETGVLFGKCADSNIAGPDARE